VSVAPEDDESRTWTCGADPKLSGADPNIIGAGAHHVWVDPNIIGAGAYHVWVGAHHVCVDRNMIGAGAYRVWVDRNMIGAGAYAGSGTTVCSTRSARPTGRAMPRVRASALESRGRVRAG
jgi:hypothetical protein